MYRQKHNLELLYKSLYEQSYYNFKIYFVDNNPDNSDTEFSRGLNKTLGLEIEYISSGKNTGFAGGNNIGANAAIKENIPFIFFLNNDTIPHKHCIEELIKPLKASNDIAASAPLIFYWNGIKEPGKIQEFGSSADFRSYKITKYFEGCNYALTQNEIPELRIVDLLPGTAVMIKTDVLQKTGLWEEMYFAYGDEIDLAKRIREQGYKSVAVKNAILWHNHKWIKENKSGYYFEYYLIQRNKYLYFRKFKLWKHLFASFLNDIIKFPFKLIWFIKVSGMKLSYYYLKGTFAGIVGKSGIPDFLINTKN